MKTKVVEYISRIQDGGAETIVKDYALLLDKEQFDVTIICEDYKKNSANFRILRENGVKSIFTYGSFNYPHRLIARIFGARYKAFLLKKELQKINPDVVHIHLESLEVISILAKDLKDTKLVFTCHNVPDLCIGKKRPREEKACKYLLENNGLQIIALHSEMADTINKMFGINNTIVLNNGINFNKFLLNNSSNQEIKNREGIPTDRYVVGHIGRFVYQKNHDFLIEVFKEINNINKKTHLLLIGSGELESEIRKKISNYNLNDYVTITSSRTDVSDLLKIMDVFLFPSRFEGLSLSMLEAQVCAVPCVISNHISEDTFCSKNITVLSYDDPIKKWAQSCLKPKGNIKKYNNLENYNLCNTIRLLEQIYKES